MVIALVGVALWVLLAAPVPVLDEESYLDIAAQASPLRPYDWWRAWQPWNSGREPDAFVFAHPPGHLWWVELVTAVVPSALGLRGLKIAAALPWALLLGASVAGLAARVTRRPGLAVLGWLGAPVVALGLQRGLMPDLALAACMAAAVLGWRQALSGDRRAAVLGGLALAAGTWVKYPALVLVPALLLHAGLTRSAWRRTLPFWGAMALPLVVGEAWLWATYGRPHIVEVLSRAGEISRGEPAGRVLGVLARAFVLGLPGAALVAGLRRSLAWGAAAAVGALALAWSPADLDARLAIDLLPFAVVGGIVLALLTLGLSRWARGLDRSDGLLLSLWGLAVMAGVLIGHNYAAPRYLLPAAAPLALLACRAVDARSGARALLGLTAAAGIFLGGALTLAEHRFFEAGDALASRVSDAWPTPGVSTGEWSFRWRLAEQGWERLGPDSPSGSLLVAPVNASPGPVPEGATLESTSSYGRFPLHVVSAEDRVGLYAETLGARPLGWGTGPLESATVWRVP